MLNKQQKNRLMLFSVMAIFLFAIFIPDSFVHASTNFGLDQVGQDVNLGTQDIRVTIARIINIALSLLGVVAIVIIIYGGFVYMTAAGDESKIATSKRILINASIGLAIILASYAITAFIISRLGQATGAIPTTPPANCTDPVFAQANPQICGGGGFNPCVGNNGQQFVVRSITPSTLNSNTGMNNFAVRAIFSQGLDSSFTADQVLTIQRGGSDVSNEFNFRFLDTPDNSVVEVMAISGNNVDTLSAGSYEVIINGQIISNSGNQLVSNTSCGAFPTNATFDVNTNGVVDSQSPAISNITYNGFTYGGTIALPRGKVYQIGSAITDNSGAGYVRLEVQSQTGGQPVVVYDGPLVNRGSQATFSDPYNFVHQWVIPSNAILGEVFDVTLTAYDIDHNSTVATSQFTVVGASCAVGTGAGSSPECRGNGECTQDADCLSGICANIDPVTGFGQCLAVPLITDVNPWDGAGGNWITIIGQFFGSSQGTVEFGLDTDNNNIPDVWVPANMAQCGGQDVWNDSWIIVEVPQNDGALPNLSQSAIRVTHANGDPRFVDSTTDSKGPITGPNNGLFTKDNSLVRPGLCSVAVAPGEPNAGATAALPNTPVVATGQAFGSGGAGSLISFGGLQAPVSLWSDTQIDTEVVGNLQPGTVGVVVSVGSESSNGIPFRILSEGEALAPIIESIAPGNITAQSYITITGQRFGNQTGIAYLCAPGEQTPCNISLNVSLPNACGDTWSDTQIIAEVPNGTAVNSYQVVIENSETSLQSLPGTTDSMTVIAGAPMPSICSLAPTNGPAPLPNGHPGLDIRGVNFSNSPSVYFWGRDSDPSNVASWLLESNPLWNSVGGLETVNTQIPTDVASGYSMQTGPIAVQSQAGQLSNTVRYTVNDCRNLDPSDIPTGMRCCTEGPSAGVLRDSSFICPGEVREAGYVWRFTTGRIPNVPYVVEACDELLGSVLSVKPSPTPWRDHADGENACVNGAISVNFSMEMNLTASPANNYIRLYTCGTGSQPDCENNKVDITNEVLLQYQSGLPGGGSTLNIRNPISAGDMKPNTWYHVELLDALESYEIVSVLGANQIRNQPLQRTKACSTDTAYCFDFKTSAQQCALSQVNINPGQHTTDMLGLVLNPNFISGSNTPLYYYLWGKGNQVCSVLPVDGLGWNWNIDYLPANANINIAPGEGYTDSRATATALLDTGVESVEFSASISNPLVAISGVRTIDFLQLAGLPQGEPLNLSFGNNGLVVTDPQMIYDFDMGSNATMTVRYKLNSNSFDPNNPTGNGWAVIPGGNWQKQSQFADKGGDFGFAMREFVNVASGNHIRRSIEFHEFDSAGSTGDLNYIISSIEAFDDWTDQTLADKVASGEWTIPGWDGVKPASAYYEAIANGIFVPRSAYWDEYEIQVVRNGDYFELWHRNATKNSERVFMGRRLLENTNLRGVSNWNLYIGGRPGLGQYIDGSITAFTLEKLFNSSSNLQTGAVQSAPSYLSINLGDPRVIESWPNCADACVNATITAIFNRQMDPGTYTAGTNFYRCADENCATLTPEPFQINSVLNSTPDPFDERLELNVEPLNPLIQNTWYTVSLDQNIISVGSVDAVGAITAQGVPLAPYTWKFRTRNDGAICVADRVVVEPSSHTAYSIGEKTRYSSRPFTNPDSCSPIGQELNPWDFGWRWQTVDQNGNQDVTVATVSNFSSVGIPKPSCNYGCLPIGSDISNDVTAPGLCGNDSLDPGEDCDIASSNQTPGVTCSLNCLNLGTSAPVCGNGSLDAGEDCDDGGSIDGDGCSSTCLNEGSSKVFDNQAPSWCGSTTVTAGEDCDINITGETEGITCSPSCLNLGTQTSQFWCDRNATQIVGNTTAEETAECRGAISLCGNSSLESGEECEYVPGIGVYVFNEADPANPILTNANSSSCSNNCLLKDICGTNVPNTLLCDPATEEGCNVDCTLQGSSVEGYNVPSICGDGVTGAGEFKWCEYDSTEADAAQAFGENPIQAVTAVGQSIAINGKQETTIQSTLTRVRGELADLSVPDQISGLADYTLQCGFVENDTTVAPYNNCLNAGDGVGNNSCCYARPIRTGEYPVDGQGIGGGAGACLNTYISVIFDKQIDESTLFGNLLVAEGHAAAEAYDCVANGEQDFTAEVSNTLAYNGQSSPSAPTGILQKIWTSIKTFFAKIFYSLAHASTVPNVAVGINNWCVGGITAAPELSYVYDTNGNVIETKVSLYIDKLLNPNSVYAVILDGGVDGIKDIQGVGIGNPDDITQLDDSFVFRTGNDVCRIQSVDVDPPSHTYTSSNIPFNFTASVTATNGQLLSPIPNVYDWVWSWAPQNDPVFDIPTLNTPSDQSSISISSKDIEGSRITSAQANIIADQLDPIRGVGRVFSGNTNLTSIFCENSWPPVNYFPYEEGISFGNTQNQDGVDANGNFDGTELSGIGGEYFNFKTSYCADAGRSADATDDLPYLKPFVFTSPAQLIDADVLKKFLFFNDLNDDIIGIQIFKNENRKSIKSWYDDKFGNSFDPSPSSGFQFITISGYEGLADGSNYYVNALNESSNGTIYNNVYLFSINADAQNNTLQVFDQLINSLEFNINISDLGYCIADTVPNTGILPTSPADLTAISSISCNTDFDCIDAVGTPFSGTNGMCSNAKTKMLRDWDRLGLVQDAQSKIQFGLAGVPRLESGTYIPGLSYSRWPSWGNTLGSIVGGLGSDPINYWTSCNYCQNANSVGCSQDSDCGANDTCVLVESQTCWDDANTQFICPAKSSVFGYEYDETAGDYMLHAPLEYFVQTDSVVQEFVGINNFDSNPICTNIIISPTSGSCGNRIVNTGEQCDPPGFSQTTTSGCSAGEERVQTCNNQCQLIDGACNPIDLCGNGRVNLGEVCDDGVLNGTYGHCDLDCNSFGSSGYCGNGVLDTFQHCRFDRNTSCTLATQDADCGVGVDCIISPLEVCDIGISASIGFCDTTGATCVDDTACASTYGTCIGLNDPTYHIEPANSCASDCQSTGGYCGDGIVQPAYEQCDDGNTDNNDSCNNVCTIRCNIQPPGMISHWTADGTADDSVGTNHGTMFGDASFAPGKVGLAFSLNGLNGDGGHINVGNDSSLDLVGDFTIMMWVNPAILEAPGYNPHFISKGNGVGANPTPPNDFYWVHLPQPTGQNRFVVAGNTGISTTGAIPVGAWSHIAIVRNGNTLTSYIDGVASGRLGQLIDMPTNGNDLRIGSRTVRMLPNFTFDGLIDEVQIFGRALSQAEVNQVYSFANDIALCRIEQSTPPPPPLPAQTGNCGNNIIDQGEVCDLGAQNGIACVPAYGQDCNYCSNDCQEVLYVEPTAFCGDRAVNGSEVCDINSSGQTLLLSGTINNYYTHVIGDPFLAIPPEGYPLACAEANDLVSQQAGNFVVGEFSCLNQCTNVVNTCTECGLKDLSIGAAVPRIAVLNPMMGDTPNSLWSDEVFVGLYGSTNQPWYAHRGLPSNFKNQNNLFQNYFDSGNNIIVQTGNSGVESSLQCDGSYRLKFDRWQIPVDPINGGTGSPGFLLAGDFFDYPVDGEFGSINNEIIVSPAVPEGTIRVVTRWTDKEVQSGNGVEFVSNVYSAGLGSYDSYMSRLTSGQGVIANNFCKEIEKDPNSYWQPILGNRYDTVDDDNTATGFAANSRGASNYNNVQWNNINSWMELDTVGKTLTAPGITSGDFNSRVMDAGTSINWATTTWTPQRPYNKELPNNGGVEFGYPAGNANMSGNLLLLHMNEGSGLVTDSSGQNNNTSNFGASYSQTGKFGRAMGFDGQNNYIRVDMPLSGATTFETWATWNKAASGPQSTIGLRDMLFVAGPTGTGGGPDIFFYDSNSDGIAEIYWNTWDATANPFKVPAFPPFTGAVLREPATASDGNFHHYVVVVNSARVVLYYDGQIIGEAQNTKFPNGNTLYIGGAPGYRWPGKMDEFAVYSNALSTQEIEDHYRRGAMNLQFQVRTCSQLLNDNCFGTNFVGPDGTSNTFYEEINNKSLNPPSFGINIGNDRYFQYKAFFKTYDSSLTPELKSVEIGLNAGVPIDTCFGGFEAGNGNSVYNLEGGVYMHPLDSLNNTFIQSFTIKAHKPGGPSQFLDQGPYAVFIEAVSGSAVPIYNFIDSDLQVEIYEYHNDLGNERAVYKPTQVFNIRDAAGTSSNPLARYWHVFNIIKNGNTYAIEPIQQIQTGTQEVLNCVPGTNAQCN